MKNIGEKLFSITRLLLGIAIVSFLVQRLNEGSVLCTFTASTPGIVPEAVYSLEFVFQFPGGGGADEGSGTLFFSQNSGGCQFRDGLPQGVAVDTAHLGKLNFRRQSFSDLVAAGLNNIFQPGADLKIFGYWI